jgi:predicted membrane protein
MLATSAAVLCLIQVFSMRWNIVIGGQLMSKSLRGLRSPYEPDVYGREGILAAIALILVPFVILYVFDRLVGLEEEPAAAEPHAAPAEGAPAATH